LLKTVELSLQKKYGCGTTSKTLSCFVLHLSNHSLIEVEDWVD
jgi:hypothetical protein